MRDSRTISLFSDRPDVSQGPSSFVASLIVHCIVFGAIAYGIVHQPQIRHRTEHYAVRHIDFHENPATPRPAAPKIRYPFPPAAGGEKSSQRSAPELARQLPQLDPGPQTLVQPKTPFHLKSHAEIPVPQVMIWTPEKDEPQTIVPPRPQPLTASAVEPSLAPPNEEIELASQPIASSELPSLAAPIPASTTSPIRLEVPEAPQLPPAQSSNAADQPTPAAVLSLSDLRMPEGTAELPPINETVRSSGQGLSGTKPGGSGNAPGSAGAGSEDKNEPPVAEAAKPEPVKQAKEAAPAPPVEEKALPKAAAQPTAHATGTLDTASADSPPLPESHFTSERIALPKNGQFGMIVVGSSMQERYPETARLWSGRLAYTVFLHVGAVKSWTLQYTLPRSEEATAGGNITRIEPPWPYNIVRPNIPPDQINADALMVHGYITAEGRFEGLSVAFPPDFPLKQFVLDSLTQWQFRPATQNGQKLRVEVLLIIPDIQ